MTQQQGGRSPVRGPVYFEFTPVGQYVKVAALDEHTGREAVVVGARGASQQDLQRLALRRLEMLLSKS